MVERLYAPTERRLLALLLQRPFVVMIPQALAMDLFSTHNCFLLMYLAALFINDFIRRFNCNDIGIQLSHVFYNRIPSRSAASSI